MKYKQQLGLSASLAGFDRIWHSLQQNSAYFGRFLHRIIYTIERFLTRKQNLENQVCMVSEGFGFTQFESATIEI